MAAHNQKLPDREKLIEHLMVGMDRRMIAALYKVQVCAVRQRFANLDMMQIEREIMAARKPAPPPIIPPRQPGIRILADKIVITREHPAGELGGTALRSVSLPPISYYVASLLEARA